MYFAESGWIGSSAGPALLSFLYCVSYSEGSVTFIYMIDPKSQLISKSSKKLVSNVQLLLFGIIIFPRCIEYFAIILWVPQCVISMVHGLFFVPFDASCFYCFFFFFTWNALLGLKYLKSTDLTIKWSRDQIQACERFH